MRPGTTSLPEQGDQCGAVRAVHRPSASGLSWSARAPLRARRARAWLSGSGSAFAACFGSGPVPAGLAAPEPGRARGRSRPAGARARPGPARAHAPRTAGSWTTAVGSWTTAVGSWTTAVGAAVAAVDCAGFIGRQDVARRLVVVIGVSAERGAEVPKPVAERLCHLGEPLGTEHEQRHHEHEQQVCWLKDVADHSMQRVAARRRSRAPRHALPGITAACGEPGVRRRAPKCVCCWPAHRGNCRSAARRPGTSNER